MIIQAILSDSEEEKEEELSAKNAAKTLAGVGSFSLSESFFDALQKGTRMVVFLILPAIAWENLSFIAAIRKGIYVLKKNLNIFVGGFLLTLTATFIIYLPPGIIFYISGKFNVKFEDWVWVTTLIYCAFAWSFSMYLEQMFTAELYLWHLKWEKAVRKAKKYGQKIPKLNQIDAPSILDRAKDLLP